MKFVIFCSLVILFLIIPPCSMGKKDRIRLRDVEVLTLVEGKWTTGRRNSPIMQLKCIGGYCKRARISTVQCYNRGFDGRDVQWECKADMPSNYKFGRMEVLCEGYDYPEDDYILAGSCGLEYSIEETGSGSDSSYYNYYKNYESEELTGLSAFFKIAFIAFWVILFAYLCCMRRDTEHAGTPYPGADDDYRRHASAPPPPGFRNDTYGDSCGRSQGPSCSSSNTQSSGPGFYSGLGAGGLLGYLFGSSTNTESRYRGSRSYYDSGYRYSPPRSSSSGGSHSASGFASTSRR